MSAITIHSNVKVSKNIRLKAKLMRFEIASVCGGGVQKANITHS